MNADNFFSKRKLFEDSITGVNNAPLNILSDSLQ